MTKNRFISFDFFAMTIIKIKQNLFGIEYITVDEFYYIKEELQKVFNREDNGIIIHSDFHKFDPDNINVNNSVITIVKDPTTNFVINANLVFADYLYIIVELIMEYAENEIREQREKFEKFRNENPTFEDRQSCLLKRLSKQ